VDAGGVIIRTATDADVPAMARVNVDSWRSAYRGIVPDAHLAGLSYPKQQERLRRYMATPGTVYFVADSIEAGVVGYVTGGRERTGDPQFTGEIYAIYILPQHHRRGIGRALIQAWTANMRQAGFNSALVWALADNMPAINFYQRLGARPVREQMIEIGGASLRETAYGWSDFGAILEFT
jgi:ribosomal protein S18 acetylase RimI-like enzyme